MLPDPPEDFPKAFPIEDQRQETTEHRVLDTWNSFKAHTAAQIRENMRGFTMLLLLFTFCSCIFDITFVGALKIYRAKATLEETITACKGLGELLGLTLLPVIATAIAFYFATENK